MRIRFEGWAWIDCVFSRASPSLAATSLPLQQRLQRTRLSTDFTDLLKAFERVEKSIAKKVRCAWESLPTALSLSLSLCPWA